MIEPDPLFEDARRKAARMAHLQASAAAAAEAGSDAYRAVSGQLRDAHRGLFDMTPQAQAALMAAQRRVGDGTSAGRDLQALGGTFDPADYGCSPAPPRADLSRLNSPPGYQRTENPLKRWSRENR